MALDGDGGNNNIGGTSADEVFNGFDGNDTLNGNGGGIDTLNGGNGNDLLYVRADNEAHGDAGNDVLNITGETPAILDGGADYDILQFNGGYDISSAIITGIEQLNAYGDGRLTATQLGSFALVSGYAVGYTTASLVLTQGGTATVVLDNVNLTNYFQITGSTQADRLTFDASYTRTVFAYMGFGNDRVSGASGDDSMRGESGSDTLLGNLGNDSLDGGAGADSLIGGAGNDYLLVDFGDTVNGGLDDDLISVRSNGVGSVAGSGGVDTLRFESGYDFSSAILANDIEKLQTNGTVLMTAAQLATFDLVEGYNASQTSASLKLTQGGAATVNLGVSLTQTWYLTGSGQADLITFTAGHAGAIQTNLGYGNDSVLGSDGNDSLYGEAGSDTLQGALGADYLDGGEGVDTLGGGEGDDYLEMRTGDTGMGDAGNDYFQVESSYVAEFDGGLGTGDIMRFAGSYDITGAKLSGIEQLNLNGGSAMTASQLNSFARVQGYADSTTSAQVTLTQGGVVGLHLQNLLTSGFTLYGSADADLVTVDATYIYAVAANGYAGNDSLTGGGGNDSLNGGLGVDTVNGGAGNDTLAGDVDDWADVLSGGAGNDLIYGRSNDVILGDNGTDFIVAQTGGIGSIDGGVGADTLRVESNYDLSSTTITGVEQLNIYFGSRFTAAQLDAFTLISGYDTPYTSADVTLTQGGTAAVRLSGTLTAGFTLYGSADADILTFTAGAATGLNVQAAEGNDSIIGSLGRDTMNGGLGDDTLNGGAGNDSLDGVVGNDMLMGGNGDDYLIGRYGSQLLGGADNDLLSVADTGVLVLNGGAGTDTVRFESSYDLTGATLTGVEVLAISSGSLTTAQLGSFATVTGYSAGYTSINMTLTVGGTANVNLSSTLVSGVTIYGAAEAEILSFNAGYVGAISFNGGTGNDIITAASGNDGLNGNYGDDSLLGMNGNDYLTGGVGRDTLVGGDGADTLYGGSGQDVFLFGTVGSSTAATPDQIFDFEAPGANKGDKIDVSGIDADGGAGAQDSFIFGSVGMAGLSLVDDVSGHTLVRLNTDADADFEAVIRIIDYGTWSATSYTAADFNL